MNDIFKDFKTVKNGDATIAYAVANPTGKCVATVCLLASTGRGPDDFVPLTNELVSQGIRVILPWPRNSGASVGPVDNIDFHDLASDAAAALSAEKGEGSTFVAGHAFGCWIARTVAQNYPALVDGIILLAAGGGKWPEELSRAIETAMSPDSPEEERLSALRLAFFSEGHDPTPWLEGWSADLVKIQRAARSRTDRDSWWPSGTVPILDIVGLQDPFRPEQDLEFYVREFSPRVELITVDGASHALPDEKPQEVAVLMSDWIKHQSINNG